jgi:hypothetical protein
MGFLLLTGRVAALFRVQFGVKQTRHTPTLMSVGKKSAGWSNCDLYTDSEIPGLHPLVISSAYTNQHVCR